MITDKTFSTKEFIENLQLLIDQVAEKMKEKNPSVTIEVNQSGPLQYDIIAQEPGFTCGVTIALSKSGHVVTRKFYGE